MEMKKLIEILYTHKKRGRFSDVHPTLFRYKYLPFSYKDLRRVINYVKALKAEENGAISRGEVVNKRGISYGLIAAKDIDDYLNGVKGWRGNERCTVKLYSNGEKLPYEDNLHNYAEFHDDIECFGEHVESEIGKNTGKSY